MASTPNNYAYTNLQEADVLTLTLNGTNYDVAMFSGSWPLNSIPEAVCVLALGRNVWTQAVAQAHQTLPAQTAMSAAKVYFHPKGSYRVGGDTNGIHDWPDAKQLIFDGYYSGYSYQKFGGTAGGKVYLVVHLRHWLSDLDFTSSLSSISHPANPAILTFPSVVMPQPTEAGASGNQGIFINSLIGNDILLNMIPTDLWGAIQKYLCAMATWDGFDPRLQTPGLPDSALKPNRRAARALARIEGAGGQCGTGGPTMLAYRDGYGQPIPLAIELSAAYAGIAQGLADNYINNMIHLSTWQAMVGYFCPQYQLDVCPAVDRAIVVPSLPGYNGGVWRKINVGEYEGIEQSAELARPIRAVVVHGSMSMEGGSNLSQVADSGVPVACGVYVSNAVSDGDGAVIYLPMPTWIANIAISGQSTSDPSGQKQGGNINTATTPGNGKAAVNPPNAMGDPLREVCNKFAHSLYVQQVLRGRSGMISGKLRFDIAPGSHVQLEGSPELFVGQTNTGDSLAGDQFGQVISVSVEINCESRRASTSFKLASLRSATENQDKRLSIGSHPLYGSSVPAGLPLVPELALPADDDPDGT